MQHITTDIGCVFGNIKPAEVGGESLYSVLCSFATRDLQRIVVCVCVHVCVFVDDCKRQTKITALISNAVLSLLVHVCIALHLCLL